MSRLADFKRDFILKAPCWYQDKKCDLPTQVLSFAATSPSQPFSRLLMVPPHSSGQNHGGPLFSDHQQAVHRLPELVHLESDFPPICLANMLMQMSLALVLSAAQGVP